MSLFRIFSSSNKGFDCELFSFFVFIIQSHVERSRNRSRSRDLHFSVQQCPYYRDLAIQSGKENNKLRLLFLSIAFIVR